jgi:hypothetical protein
MTEPTPDPVAAAIERGGATARLLVAHRDALIHHLAAILLIAGPNGMVACAYGAAEAVRIAHERRTRGEAPPCSPT